MNISNIERDIAKKLEKEEPLNRDEVRELFRDRPEVVALFDEADFVSELAKRLL